MDNINPVERELKEKGLLPPPPPVNPLMPPSDGEYATPHYLTFAGLINQISHTYRFTFDEAMRECPFAAKAMRRDPVIMSALRKRQIPVAQLDGHLEAQDENDPQQLQAVANLEQIIKKEIPRFQELKMWLLEAIWWGRSATQMTYGFDFSRGYKRMLVKDHRPIMGDKLFFKWSGEPGVLVHPQFKGTWELTERGRCHFFTPTEREQVIIHHFEPEDSDFFDFEMAGAVFGVGVRGRLYWFWWLKSKILGLLTDFLQRVAFGWTIYFYEQGNEQSLKEVTAMAQAHQGGQGILFPRKADGTGPDVKRLEPGMAGAELFRAMVMEYFDDIMTDYILGQSLTHSTGSTGMGSGVAEAHQDTRSMLMTYDAVSLGETMTTDLVKPLARWNHPGLPAPRWVFDVDKPNVESYLNGAQTLYEMGVSLDADDLRSTLGLPKPEPNHEIAAKMAPEQPATIGGAPQGVPVESQAGPQQADQAQADQSAQAQPAAMPGVPGQSNAQPIQMQAAPVAPVIRQQRQRWKEAMTRFARRNRAAILKSGVNHSNGTAIRRRAK